MRLLLNIRLLVKVVMLMLLLSGNIMTYAELPTGLVDPTRPLSYVQPSQQQNQNWVLSSVLITASSKVAVINGNRVLEKQIIDGAEVVSIQPGRVVLQQGDQRQTLKVHSDSVKQ